MRWNPYQTFIWTKNQLAAWFDTYGAWGQYDGKLWKPVSTALGAGRYEIRFKEFIPT